MINSISGAFWIFYYVLAKHSGSMSGSVLVPRDDPHNRVTRPSLRLVFLCLFIQFSIYLISINN